MSGLLDAVDFWCEYLNGFTPYQLVIPHYISEPAMSLPYRRVDYSLPCSLADKLKAPAEEGGASFTRAVYAAWGMLVSRYIGSEDVVFGITISFDPTWDWQVVPLRLRIQEHLSVRGLLRQVDEEILKLKDHTAAPLDTVARTLGVSAVDLVHTVVAVGPEEWPNQIEPQPHLAILVHPEGPDRLSAYFNENVFNEDTVVRVLANFAALLSGFADRPWATLSEIDSLSSSEREIVLRTFNQTASDFPWQPIQQVFEREVDEGPERIALVAGDRELNYRELNARSNRLAHLMQKLGVMRGTAVALLTERSPDAIIAALAILKAGAYYVPLDPEYPTERLSYMVKDTAPALLLTESALKYRIPGYQGPVILMDADTALIEQQDGQNLECLNTPEDIAYVIYTSGSTGRPKGVLVPHSGVVRLVKNTTYAHIDPCDRIVQTASMSFDASTYEIWAPLLNGARLIIVPSDTVWSLNSLSQALLSYSATAGFLTTALFHRLVDSYPESLVNLRSLLVGGEALSVAHVKKALRYIPDGRLVNGYGPTENTTFSCCQPVREVPDGTRSIPLGPPISNSTAYVLDEQLRPVPIGVIGEIFVGGAGLAQGYLNQPELTAKAFIPNPHAAEPEALMYRTGDKGRWLPDGTLEYWGRTDHQVKIRGFRVELGEIETAVNSHQAVRECVVVMSDEGPAEKRLVAYFSATRTIEQAELREHLRQTLPKYMIPHLLVQMDHLPLTANLKIDRGALPPPDFSVTASGWAYVSPRNDLEELIADIWRHVLNNAQIGVTDNFFEIGGDSLSLAEVRERLSKLLNRDIPIVTLLTYPTVEGIAGYLANEAKPLNVFADQVQRRAELRAQRRGSKFRV